MRGRVLEVADNTVLIEPERPAGCFGCMQGECKKGLAPVKAEKGRNMELALGQLVETGSNGRALFVQSLAAVLPLPAGFIAGYLATPRIFPSGGEGLRSAVGALLLFACAAGFYLFRRRFPPKNFPRIVRILSS
jgi:hypothetical protein